MSATASLAGHVAVGVAGGTVLVFTAISVIRVLVVPRPPARGPSTLAMVAVRSAFTGIARLRRTYVGQDGVLVFAEPVALVVLLVSWMLQTLIGFALLIWAVSSATWTHAFEEAGSSVFTLGATLGHTGSAQALDFAAAGAGLVLVAVEIAYLPALYSAYNRRETTVTMLESRAGAPAWGPEILIRHLLVASLANLQGLFAEWERWAADVAESHTSYPSLIHLRSPRARNSWVVSLLAALDAASIALAVDPAGAPMEGRMFVRMGFMALRDIAEVAGIPVDHDPSPDHPIDLPREEFERTVDRLAELGYPMSRPRDEMWMHFRGWRVNYETAAYRLADLVHAPPAPWSGPRRGLASGSLGPVRPVDRQPDRPDGGPAGRYIAADRDLADRLAERRDRESGGLSTSGD